MASDPIPYEDGELVEIMHPAWGPEWFAFKFSGRALGFWALESSTYISLITIIEGKSGFEIRRKKSDGNGLAGAENVG